MQCGQWQLNLGYIAHDRNTVLKVLNCMLLNTAAFLALTLHSARLKKVTWEDCMKIFLYLFVLNDNTMQRLQLYAMSTKEFRQEYFAKTEMSGIAMHVLECLAKSHAKSELLCGFC